MADEPTLIFVHGALHGPEAFQDVSQELQRAGYSCVDDLQLPSSDGTPEVSLDDDVEAIRRAITKVIDERGHDCIIVSHSFGAVPSSQAIKGLIKEDRNGRPGVLRMVCLAPNLPKEGESFSSQLMGFLASAGLSMPPQSEPQVSMRSKDTMCIMLSVDGVSGWDDSVHRHRSRVLLQWHCRRETTDAYDSAQEAKPRVSPAPSTIFTSLTLK